MDQISDHFKVNFTVTFSAPKISPKVIFFRKIKDIEIDFLKTLTLLAF